MIADQIAAAVAGARTVTHLDNLARILYRGLAEGHVHERDAETVEIAIQARREGFGTVRATRAALSASIAASKARRAPRTPDRQRSLERRRRIAASGAMPPALACRFTLGEMAALSVVAREVQRRGWCELPVDAIAAMAGVSRRTAQNAMKAAAALGIIVLTERRRRGAPSLTNVVQIADGSWRAWLRLKGGEGAEKCGPRNTKYSKTVESVERPLTFAVRSRHNLATSGKGNVRWRSDTKETGDRHG